VQKERLHQYLAQSPTLQALYFAKQQLNGFLGMKSLKRKRARRMLPQFLALIAQFEQSPARALAATLKSWLEPIVRMWRFTKSNGITEGFHTKMERLFIIKGGQAVLIIKLLVATNRNNERKCRCPQLILS